jgi:methylase of polypeptide subunit release factors
VDVVERLGELLREAGFAGERHSALAGMPGGAPPADVLAALDRPEDARLATLLTLFHNDGTVARTIAERAFQPLTIEDLAEAGLLETDAAGVRARTRLSVIDSLIVAGDPARDDYRTQSFVVSLSAASISFAGLTVRREVEAALDLGTGSGVQALLAARHADRVVGVDVNPHALSLAGISQRLNSLDNISWLRGDWLEPVRGRRFDLVVANPPVVISPDNTLLYRDSAIGGQQLSRRLVGECAEHLAEGGFATVFCNWTHAQGAWEDAPREWVDGLGCDALLLNIRSREPLVYALDGLVYAPTTDRAALAETVERWTEHFTRAGAEQIASGVVVLRRSSGPNWTQAFKLDPGDRRAGGDQLQRMFTGGDLLTAHSGVGQLRELLSAAWRLVEGHRLDQSLVHENGAYASGDAVMWQDPGIGLNARVDPQVVPLLVGCDGQRTLADVLATTPIPAGLDQSGFHSLCLGTVKDLIARGFLVRDSQPEEAHTTDYKTAGDASN